MFILMFKYSVAPSAEILITSYFTSTGHSQFCPAWAFGYPRPLQLPEYHPEMVHDSALMPQGIDINIVHSIFLLLRFGIMLILKTYI